MAAFKAPGSIFSAIDVGIFVDGVAANAAEQRRVTILNAQNIALLGNWSMMVTSALAAGNHLFEVRAVNSVPGTSPANVSSGTTPLLQGQLTITTLKK
jgi:hypothetical protein